MTTENLIWIKGGAYNHIKKALRQWIDLYSNDLQDDLIFELYKNGPGHHIIKADDRLSNEKFFFLVNYLNYPEGIEYKTDIEGFTTGKEENVLKNKRLLVYISPNDEEGDNVFVTTPDNKNFKVDFGGNISEQKGRKIFRLPDSQNFGAPEILRVNKKEFLQRQETETKDHIAERFKIIPLIGVGFLIIGLIISLFDEEAFIKFNFFSGMGLGLWFFMDYKMLQSDKHYNYCFLLSLAFLGYCLLVKRNLGFYKPDLADLGALYPLSLLITQKPARFIFKKLLNREPVVHRPLPTFWDGVYTIILFFGFAILSLVVIDKFK